MAMSGGNPTEGLKNEPNVTPMIDVLLVLLIIFIMIIPMGRKAIDVQLPDPHPPPQPPNTVNKQIVLEVLPGDQFAVNKTPIAKDDLLKYLKDTYDPRPEKIIFIKGDPTVKYQQVIFAMDAARGAGVKVIGATPKSAEGGGKQ
jgi:biopolymer transport protein ExbD